MPCGGLSPHERGNLVADPLPAPAPGPIPARAGQPFPRSTPSSSRRAYPRTSGATRRILGNQPRQEGLSPHERGNPDRTNWITRGLWPIPARAGQPSRRTAKSMPLRAYPRTSGATLGGSQVLHLLKGLSPHERGNLLVAADCRVFDGPIPARAGQPGTHVASPHFAGAYPRTSGATRRVHTGHKFLMGLSPHERGNLVQVRHQQPRRGPIPARAGQPVRDGARVTVVGAYPRTSGATGWVHANRLADGGLSPHERGNHYAGTLTHGTSGPIPARAGQPSSMQDPDPRIRAYPRTSGATMLEGARNDPEWGLSPHERGNRCV